MRELIKGQPVFLKSVNNNARSGLKISECTIVKIGRKYFEVSNEHNHILKFDISSLNQVAELSSWKLYFTKEEILDEVEYGKLIFDIRSVLSHHKPNLSLDQLRKITKIIGSDQ
jgi:hypothetical protein